jgi:tetratricopeptide (TPR) repeat protein
MSKLFDILGGLVAAGLLVVVAGGILYRWLKNSEDPARLVFKWLLTLVLTGLVIGTAASASGPSGRFLAVAVGALCGLALAAIWVPHLINAIASPFMNLYTGGNQPPDPQPLYSVAQARRKQGKYQEAVAEIRKQLAQFPGDFYGLLLLAEIQVENMDDLSGAQSTVERLLAEKERSPTESALALNRLADWHLKYGQDPAAAEGALRRILELFPDTPQSYLATQRLAHLTSPEMLADKKEPHRIKLGQYQQNIGLLSEPSDLVRPPTENLASTAAGLVRHLEEHPGDSEARERLALIYADHYQRLDLATDQLEELILQPNAPVRQIVHWLNLLADIRIKYAGDLTGARDALQRIVDLFSRSAAAETARSRIAHLPLELRARQKSQALRMGSYESNVGLNGSA